MPVVRFVFHSNTPDSKIYGANMGPTWGRKDPGGPHVGPMNLAIWDPQQGENIILSIETESLSRDRKLLS